MAPESLDPGPWTLDFLKTLEKPSKCVRCVSTPSIVGSLPRSNALQKNLSPFFSAQCLRHCSGITKRPWASHVDSALDHVGIWYAWKVPGYTCSFIFVIELFGFFSPVARSQHFARCQPKIFSLRLKNVCGKTRLDSGGWWVPLWRQRWCATGDPLVMTNIAMVKTTIFNGKIHYKYLFLWPFSIANC